MNVKFGKLPFTVEDNLKKIIHTILPVQGSVELQQDQPHKTHAWHRHQNDETLLVLEGEMKFYFDDKVQTCKKGDIVYLPSMVRHQSTAGGEGCIYLIATRLVSF